MPTREQILEVIRDHPVEIGHWVGFKDLTELHNLWLRKFLYNKDDMTLQAHRGSYKTTCLSLFFAIHCIIKPNESLIYMRKTGGDVTEIARQTAKILETGVMHEIVRKIYGMDLELYTANGGAIQTNLSTSIKGSAQITGLGIGTSITGKHADIIVTDDIVNKDDRSSRAVRETTKLAYMELQNIKNRGGRIINTGTPWHKEDAFTLMPNIERYDTKRTGLISGSQLEKLRNSMTPSLFSANYELRHIPSDDVIFLNPITGADMMNVNQGIAHIDAAYGGEDFTALTLGNVHDGKYYFYGKMWRKNVADLMDRIIDLIESNNIGRVYVELNSDKGYLVRDLVRRGVRAKGYSENMNKHVKITTYLKRVWSDVVFCEGTDEAYINQICDYTEDAEHDDAPDSASSLARIFWLRRAGE